MQKVAIFDVDGTIFRSSMVIVLTEALIQKELFDVAARKGYEKEYQAWLDREGTYEDYIDALVHSFMKNIKGLFYGDFADVAREVVEEQRHRVYRHTRDLVTGLKQQGYYLLAISQSPKVAIENFCKQLGFNKVYGRVYEIDPEDRFTGEIIDLHLIANKANIVHRAIEKESLSLEGSIGVGDTEGDISFLELVERPICFNPNAKLYKHAKRMNWEIVVERKDVIYEF